MPRGLPSTSTLRRGKDDARRPHRVPAGGNGEPPGSAQEIVDLVVGDHAYRLEGPGPWSVGRSKNCDVVIKDPYISREHARISRTEGGFVVDDLDSANGTILRGSPVSRERLDDGDELTFGRTTARLVRRTITPDTPPPKKTRGVNLPHLPGLDGLRALAVIAVLFYHANINWLPGGFLGVSIFFVLSGYLITSLLLAEWQKRGRISLKAFWLRRARRLLPALYALLLGVLTYAVVFLPGEVARLRDDALAAFFYVTNWYLVFRHQSYFEAVGRPSLFQHLWSLAVEEQFYILWPLLFFAGMLLLRRRGMFVFSLALAVASSVLMALMYHPNVDPSRLYYGTDTRAAELLFGAALAFVWSPDRTMASAGAGSLVAARRLRSGRAPLVGQLRSFWDRSSPLILDVAGLAALGGLVLFCFKMNEFQPFLYQGGFAAVSLTTVAAIAVAVNPRSHLGRYVLGQQPLRWVGLRSYSIYLWHWPVFEVTRPGLDVPIGGLRLFAIRIFVTFVLADLSYRFVENPIRRGALGRIRNSLREAHGARRWRLRVQWGTIAGAVLALCVTLGVVLANARQPAPPSYLSVKSIHTGPKAITVHKKKNGKLHTSVKHRTANAASPGKASNSRVNLGSVSAVGDSVMLGAANELQQDLGGNARIDAQEGLQVQAALDILKERRDQGQLGNIVIVDIGNNGPFTSQQFDEMMNILKGARLVVVVNDKVPRPWEQSNDQMLSEKVKQYHNKAILVDWKSASAGHPGYFWDDGIHLRPNGAQAYANLITRKIRSRLRS